MISSNSAYTNKETIPWLLDKTAPLVRGGVYFIDGAPGTGKSTILLTIAADLVRRGKKVIYVCGEEDPGQVISRCKYLRITEDILLSESAIVERIESDVEEYAPDLVIVDSLQSVREITSEGITGGTSQSRKVADSLVQLAKTHSTAIVLVGQQNKAGQASGSQKVIHMVDVHLTLYKSDNDAARGIWTEDKNRFGPTRKWSWFEMNDGRVIIDTKLEEDLPF